MTKKMKTEKKTEKTTAALSDLARKQLIAQVAGSVAGGIVVDPSSESAKSADGIATIAVDIAEAVLRKIGL